MERVNEFQFHGKALIRSAAARRFGLLPNRIPYLLSVMLAFVPFSAGQRAVCAEDSHPEPATRTLPSPAAKATGIGAPAGKSGTESEGKVQKLIVIGFVGGFARGDDKKHPEVQFAELLRERYGSNIFAGVFANHEGRKALQTVLRLLGRNESGAAATIENVGPRILLYGHSWGAAEVVIFARELGKLGIPVFLTFQVDSIRKPGRDDARIPPNVTNAINLYQSHGPLHGRTEIFAAEPARTTIMGNLHMTYEGHTINCDNYPWFARTFNRPHHEIENDPRVWDLAASLVESAFFPAAE